MEERLLISGCEGEASGYDTQLLYFTCSSLSSDDRRMYVISNRDGHPNVYVRDLARPACAIPFWEEGRLEWIPLCKHRSDWLGQDAHPHPIYNHAGNAIFFNSRSGKYVKVYMCRI